MFFIIVTNLGRFVGLCIKASFDIDGRTFKPSLSLGQGAINSHFETKVDHLSRIPDI